MKSSSPVQANIKSVQMSEGGLMIVLAVSLLITVVFAFSPESGLIAQLQQGGKNVTFPKFLMAAWCALSFLTAVGVAFQLVTDKWNASFK